MCVVGPTTLGAAVTNPALTAEDLAFLRALHDMPEDRNTWLVYADWLDDRDDPRAEFLRLAVEHVLLAEDDPARADTEARMARLRAELDPQWVMMFDPAPVANCCGRHWTALAMTDVPDLRVCHGCRSAVVYCHTLGEARAYDSCGQRVALSTRVPAAEVAREPAFQQPAPVNQDSDWEFELFLDAVPEPPPPAAPQPRAEPPPRPWWKFW
ncbi:MAG: TIGR02996 domain-containing protein [Planctomycetes bacterium]|nr:TIGR02996 domain-containing protein [Planctomycetota bacterium]